MVTVPKFGDDPKETLSNKTNIKQNKTNDGVYFIPILLSALGGERF